MAEAATHTLARLTIASKASRRVFISPSTCLLTDSTASSRKDDFNEFSEADRASTSDWLAT